MYSLKYIWMIFSISVVATELQKTPTISLKAGKVRGVVTPDGLRGYFYSYLGIPYAKVQKRFQASTPITSWNKTLEADKNNVRCSQTNFPSLFIMQDSTDGVITQEDCLNLNVYTPLPQPGAALKPVMVYIHGGAFIFGSSSSRLYGADYLVRNDVIVVSINYRLDALGFLCLGIKEAPGNVGMKDQVEALKWVKNNIKAFGGDPNNITLFGGSAGGGSVIYHLISPMSKDLFNKAIMQSGSAISPWGLQFEPLKIASQMAKQLGYNTEDRNELYKIFMNTTAEDIVSNQIPRPFGNIMPSLFNFMPCVEQKLPGVERFLTDTPYNLIATGQYTKMPMIIGYNDNEGYIFAGNEDATSIENISLFTSLPSDLQFPSNEERQTVADQVKQLYWVDKEVSIDTLYELSYFEGESQITYPTIATADLIVKSNNQDTFLYKFAYGGFLNIAKYSCGFGDAPGATHADELSYMFLNTLSDVGAILESSMIAKMTTMWTNFAKFGNPTPQETPVVPTTWLPAKGDNLSVFVIDTQFLTTSLWESDRIQFWNQTYAFYRRKN